MQSLQLPWKFLLLNQIIRKNDVSYLAEVAWRQLSHTDATIEAYALPPIRACLTRNGFPPNHIASLSFGAVKSVLVQEFDRTADVAAAIMVLWADARKEYLQELTKELTLNRRVVFQNGWSWHLAKDGFYPNSTLLELVNDANFSRRFMSKMNRLKLKALCESQDFAISLAWLSSASTPVIDIRKTLGMNLVGSKASSKSLARESAKPGSQSELAQQSALSEEIEAPVQAEPGQPLVLTADTTDPNQVEPVVAEEEIAIDVIAGALAPRDTTHIDQDREVVEQESTLPSYLDDLSRSSNAGIDIAMDAVANISADQVDTLAPADIRIFRTDDTGKHAGPDDWIGDSVGTTEIPVGAKDDLAGRSEERLARHLFFAATQTTSPSAMAEMLEAILSQFQDEQEQAHAYAKRLQENLDAEDIDAAIADARGLGGVLDNLSAETASLQRELPQLVDILIEECEHRPDLELGILAEIKAEERRSSKPGVLIGMAKTMLQIYRKILDYDIERRSLFDRFEQAKQTVIQLEDDLASWVVFGGTAEHLDSGVPSLDAQCPVSELRTALASVDLKIRHLVSQIDAQLSIQRNRIRKLITTLAEYEVAPETLVYDEVHLGTVSERLEGYRKAQEFVVLVRQLEQMVDAELSNRAASTTSALAGQLQKAWNETTALNLLESLALQQQDEELSLLLTAICSSSEERLLPAQVPDNIVEAYQAGIVKLAGSMAALDLFGQFVPSIIKQFKSLGTRGTVQLSIWTLATHFLTDQPMMSAVGWQLGMEWPDDRMPTWNSLWQKSLLNEPISFSSQEPIDALHAALELSHQSVDQIFARDSGFYARARQLKNPKMATLFNQQLLPKLHQKLQLLSNYARQLNTANANTGDGILRDLRKTVADIELALSQQKITEMYEDELAAQGLREPDAFHRRTTLSVLFQSAEGILEYAHTLLAYVESLSSQPRSFGIAELRQELEMWFQEDSIEYQFLDSIGRLPQVRHEDLTVGSTAPDSGRSAESILEQSLLGSVYLARRIPRVVGWLTEEYLSWPILLRRLLDDLAQPLPNSEEAVKILLEMDAPTQVLQLADQISLTSQQQAQSLLDKLEREVNAYRNEVARLGGVFPNFADFRSNGRWRLAKKELAASERMIREELDRQQHLYRAQARRLLERIRDTDSRLTDYADEISRAGYELVVNGFGTAKVALKSQAQHGKLFEAIGAFCDEISYQIDHVEFPLDKLQEIVGRLERSLANDITEATDQWTAQDVLSHLEHQELKPLGLPSSGFELSMMETRIKLLGNWQRLKKIKALLVEEMSPADRLVIQELFRSFANMTAMKSCKNKHGKPQINNEEIWREVFELKYPKTSVLEGSCEFIALPGQPPTPPNIATVLRVISEEDLLSYRYVFLFVPGATKPIVERISRQFHNQGLVIIDETALIGMVLAEADQRNPVGYLRSCMLKAKGAATVDIFTYNQSVTPRNAIFVGRDRLIHRIVSTSDSFALYGGRRIGKSSVLNVVHERLKDRANTRVALLSLNAIEKCSDLVIARRLVDNLKLGVDISSVDDFAAAIQQSLDQDPDKRIVILLDEVDQYIVDNPMRHLLIEGFRKLSDSNKNRFRVVLSGFMALNDCLKRGGPLPSSGPWQRMISDDGPLPNLEPRQAELIVLEGFRDILGWRFDSPMIPQFVVERTGGHPAFVQKFCDKLKDIVAKRGDQTIRVKDVDRVFEDEDPVQSFIAYVKETLDMNLDPIGRFLILWIANEEKDQRRFTWDQLREYASTSVSGPKVIPESRLLQSLEQLKVTSVVKEIKKNLFEFAVPDYLRILVRLGETEQLHTLALKIDAQLECS